MNLHRLFLAAVLAGCFNLLGTATQAQDTKNLTVLFTGDIKGWATPLQA